MNWIEDDKNDPLEFIERNGYHYGIRGFTDKFELYPNIHFSIPPLEFETHRLAGYNWRMHFKQKTSSSRMYVHFHNKINFGFRIRLPAKKYYGINDIFSSLGTKVINHNTFEPYHILSSENAVTNVIEQKVYITKEVPSYAEPISFEESLVAEQERIKSVIGDYRGTESTPPEFDYTNVINMEDYLKNPEEIPEDQIEKLMVSLG